jgi:spore photoproduct lyase
MANHFDYTEKFNFFRGGTIYEKLTPEQQNFIREVAFSHRLTFQEFRQVVEASRDLAIWGEADLRPWWKEQASQSNGNGIHSKKQILQNLQTHLKHLRNTPQKYPVEGLNKPKKREKNKIVTEKSNKKVWGMCPVASPRTVCCNLRTIDAVENCIFGCSYCTIQTFYSEKIVFDENFAEKLKSIPIEPNRFYHFGTGQSSDSLAWGNRNGNLDALCQFAADHPNILLEFKTKSDNIGYFLEYETPPNIVCSWSMNTPEIIKNEEHFTADLEQRIAAARTVADKGIKVSFHFHPMVYYRGWENEYPSVARQLMQRFQPEEVLFISFGSVTMIKPAIQKIRQLGHQTKILQMEMIPDPHGKLTYPEDIKINMFKTMYAAFKSWRERVFMYLCMEKASTWEDAFGYVYKSNEEFEKDFGRKTMGKIYPTKIKED